MFLSSGRIKKESSVTDIVSNDYRAADVFRKYEIGYCCGGKWPLETVCMMKGLNPEELIKELQQATRTVQLPAAIPFGDWSIEFLTDYIINIHHYYLRHTLTDLGDQLDHFVEEHLGKYPHLYELQVNFKKLEVEILPHIRYEEEVIFPYLRRIAHAYHSKESYASLLVKTLRKPVDTVMEQEHEMVSGIIASFRELTDNYRPPEKACTSHRVLWSKFKELDNDLAQHMFLENSILFPKALAIEKELLPCRD